LNPIYAAVGTTLIVFAVAASPAHGQPDGGPSSATPVSVEDVVVTAQKQAQRASEIGLSITTATRAEAGHLRRHRLASVLVRVTADGGANR
jgi:outer membrane cobalamin receptor